MSQNHSTISVQVHCVSLMTSGECVLRVKKDRHRKKKRKVEKESPHVPSVQLCCSNQHCLNWHSSDKSSLWHSERCQFLASDSPPLLLRAEAWWEKDSVSRGGKMTRTSQQKWLFWKLGDTPSFNDKGNAEIWQKRKRRVWSLHASSLALTQFLQLSGHGLRAQCKGGAGSSLGWRGSCGEKAWCWGWSWGGWKSFSFAAECPPGIPQTSSPSRLRCFDLVKFSRTGWLALSQDLVQATVGAQFFHVSVGPMASIFVRLSPRHSVF